MRYSTIVILVCVLITLATVAYGDDAIHSRVEKTAAGERILIEEITLNAPLDRVWNAYTTAEGWIGWAAPKAKVDLQVGGTIQTQYNPEAEIGDAGTNTLHIVSYVPKTLLILRADLAPNWPDVMKEDADNLSNVILFDAISDDITRIRSYGIGYRDRPEYDELLSFFSSANRGLYEKLKRFVED